MKLHYLQHVPFEGPAAILDWALERNWDTSSTMLYNNEELPDPASFDLLVVMGGPMGVHDEDDYPWLAAEKEFLKNVIDTGKPILGVCLGAQLLANVLGAHVQKNIVKEIGWYPVSLTPPGWESPAFKGIPATFDAFHWHGDMFRIPEGGVQIANSEACPNQAFTWNERVIGLQFHIETTRESLEALVKNCGDELLVESEYVQRPEVILDETRDFAPMNANLFKLMDNIAAMAAE